MRYPQLYVGIDVSKYKYDVAIVKEQKNLLIPSFVIEDSYTGYQQLMDRFETIRKRYSTQTFHVGMEATAHYWKNLYHFLQQQDASIYPVTVINPVQTKHFMTSQLRRSQTDKTSAQDIALFMLERKPVSSLNQPFIWEWLRDIDGQLYHLKKQRAMSLNRLRMELGKVAPELEKASRIITSQQMLTLLLQFPTAEAIACASNNELQQMRYGHSSRRFSQPFLQKVKALTKHSIAYKTGPGSGAVVKSLARQLITIDEQIALLKQELTTLFDQINPKDSLLTSIHGISKETAIIIESYVGDIRRFRNAKAFVAYFGMNPKIRHSGSSIRRKSRLEKKGNARLRHILFMAVFNMISSKSDPIYTYFHKKVTEGKPKLVAINAAMRKLLVIIYAMLKNNKPFESKTK